MKNAYEYTMELIKIDNEVMELSNQLSKASNVTERERLGTAIDRKLAYSLEIKHLLERVRV